MKRSYFKYHVIYYVTFCCLIMAPYIVLSQNTKINPFKIEFLKSEWDLRVNGYQINPNLSLTISSNNYINAEIGLTETPLLLKLKVTEKLSLLGGTKIDFSRGWQGNIEDFGVSASFGLHYDFDKSTYIQAIFDYQIKSSDNIYHYNHDNPSSFYIRSGFKF